MPVQIRESMVAESSVCIGTVPRVKTVTNICRRLLELFSQSQASGDIYTRCDLRGKILSNSNVAPPISDCWRSCFRENEMPCVLSGRSSPAQCSIVVDLVTQFADSMQSRHSCLKI